MQRVIGAFLILTATSGAGYIYCRDQKMYLERMLYLRYIFSLIRGEIGYTHAPLPEVFREVAGRIKKPYRTWLMEASRALEMRDESGFARVWSRCVDLHLKPLGLKAEHSILIKEPGTFLGSLESNTLDHTLQMYLNRLDLETEKIREGLAAKTRIGRCLGVMSGIFLIVILI